MTKRKLLLSLLNIILSLALFIGVIYAWFIQNSNVNLPTIMVESPLIKSYDIKFYTYNHIYKYDSINYNLLMYQESDSTWIEPNYSGTEHQGKNYFGIFMGAYDPIISANNNYHNIIIEFTLTYQIPSTASAALSAIADTSIANNAKTILNIPSAETYYLSSFADIQYMLKSELITANVFKTVSDDFKSTNPEKKAFDASKSELSITQLSLTGNVSDQKLYFYINVSLNDLKIQNAFPNKWATGMSFTPVYFLPDITFVIKKGGTV
jgi:hypothetical protein